MNNNTVNYLAVLYIALHRLKALMSHIPPLRKVVSPLLIAAAALLGTLTTVNAAGPDPAPLFDAVPSVSLSAPSDVLAGETFNLTITLDNSGDMTGYGPFVDLFLDSNMTLVSADYIGQPVSTTMLSGPTAQHPFIWDPSSNQSNPTGETLTITGGNVYVLELPLGAFTTGQPPVVIDAVVTMSAGAPLSTPLPIRARGGFQFGQTPLNDWCCGVDPQIVSPPDQDTDDWTPEIFVTPGLYNVSKENNLPESETATGPNFVRTWTITVDIADGATLTEVEVSDTLPDEVQYADNLVINTSGSPTITDVSTPSTLLPGGTLTRRFDSVTGTSSGSDIEISFDFTIPRDGASGATTPVLDAGTGASRTTQNGVTVGQFDPVGGGTTVPYPGGPGDCTPPCAGGGEIFDKSIAIQKTVSGGQTFSFPGTSPPIPSIDGYLPGQTVTYTLDFQVSDFFAYENIQIVDTLGDGLCFEPGSAQLTVTEHSNGGGSPDEGFGPVGITPISVTGGSCPSPTTGMNVITFDVSAAMTAAVGNGQLVGGCVPAGGTGGPLPDCTVFDDGPTEGTLTFDATVLEDYVDLPGDVSVDHGDVLENDVVISGDLLNVDDLTPNGNNQTDDSEADIVVAQGSLEKFIYAINGNTNSGAWPTELAAGDTITYRLRYPLPNTDTELLYVDDFLPPLLDATQITTYDGSGPSATPPAAGEFKLGPDDDFTTNSGLVPSLAPQNPPWDGSPPPPWSTNPDTTENRVTFYYGTFDGGATNTSVLDILFTVTFALDPFPIAGRLALSNRGVFHESDSLGNDTLSEDIISFDFVNPYLVGKKSVVATNSAAPAYQPGGAAPVLPAGVSFTTQASPSMTGTFDAGSFAGFDSDVGNIAGNDIVTFALVVQNLGESTDGAFDIIIRDSLQSPDYLIPATGPGLNLQVFHADGSPVAFTTLGGGPGIDPNDDIFGNGIELTDPDPATGACQAAGHASGHDFIIITYDLQVRPGIAPNSMITNTGGVYQYSNVDDYTNNGGSNFVDANAPLTDTATVTIGSTAGKTANPGALTVGETYRQRIVVTIPPFTRMAPIASGFVELQDELEDPGMHAVVGTESFQVLANCSDTDMSSGAFQGAINVVRSDIAPFPGGELVTWQMPEINNENGANECSFAVEIDVDIVDEDRWDGERGWLPPTNAADTADDTATVFFIDGDTGVPGDFTSGSSSVDVDQPYIDLSKSITQIYESDGLTPRPLAQEVRRGDIIVWTVSMENLGETTAFETFFEDMLSLHLQYINGSTFMDDGSGIGGIAGNGIQDGSESSLGNPNTSGNPATTGQTLEFDYNFDMLPTDVIYVSYRVRVLDSMPLGTLLNNLADADWSTLDGSQADEREYDDLYDVGGALNGQDGGEDADVDTAQVVDLTLDKSFGTTIIGVSPGGVAPLISTITFTIVNPNASTDVTTVSYTDTLPSGLEINTPNNLSNTCGGTSTAAPGTRDIVMTGGAITAGGTCTITVDVIGTAANVYDNVTSEITSDETGPGLTASDSIIVADNLAIYKEFNPSRINRGNNSTLTFTIFNPGPNDPVTNVSFTDDLPSGVTVVTPGTTPGICNVGTLDTTSTTISLTGGQLAEGEFCTFDVIVTSDTAGTYVNQSSPVSSDETGPTTLSNEATLTVVKPKQSKEEIVGSLLITDPGIAKFGEPANARLGETITWTIVINNTGPIPLSPVFVNDPLPDVLGITGASSSQGSVSVSGQTVSADLGTLNPGATATITIESVANALAPGFQVCNEAAIEMTSVSNGVSTTRTDYAIACVYIYPELPETGHTPAGEGPLLQWYWLATLAVLAGAGGLFAPGMLRRSDKTQPQP